MYENIVVAWKRLRPQEFRTGGKTLRRECLNQAMMNHENIVRLYGWTKEIHSENIISYGIVMENMALGDLESKFFFQFEHF